MTGKTGRTAVTLSAIRSAEADTGAQRDRAEQALATLRSVAERFDGATNGVCAWCASDRPTSCWNFGKTNGVRMPSPCTNPNCRSHAVRSILAPET